MNEILKYRNLDWIGWVGIGIFTLFLLITFLINWKRNAKKTAYCAISCAAGYYIGFMLYHVFLGNIVNIIVGIAGKEKIEGMMGEDYKQYFTSDNITALLKCIPLFPLIWFILFGIIWWIISTLLYFLIFKRLLGLKKNKKSNGKSNISYDSPSFAALVKSNPSAAYDLKNIGGGVSGGRIKQKRSVRFFVSLISLVCYVPTFFMWSGTADIFVSNNNTKSFGPEVSSFISSTPLVYYHPTDMRVTLDLLQEISDPDTFNIDFSNMDFSFLMNAFDFNDMTSMMDVNGIVSSLNYDQVITEVTNMLDINPSSYETKFLTDFENSINAGIDYAPIFDPDNGGAEVKFSNNFKRFVEIKCKQDLNTLTSNPSATVTWLDSSQVANAQSGNYSSPLQLIRSDRRANITNTLNSGVDDAINNIKTELTDKKNQIVTKLNSLITTGSDSLFNKLINAIETYLQNPKVFKVDETDPTKFVAKVSSMLSEPLIVKGKEVEFNSKKLSISDLLTWLLYPDFVSDLISTALRVAKGAITSLIPVDTLIGSIESVLDYKIPDASNIDGLLAQIASTVNSSITSMDSSISSVIASFNGTALHINIDAMEQNASNGQLDGLYDSTAFQSQFNGIQNSLQTTQTNFMDSINNTLNGVSNNSDILTFFNNMLENGLTFNGKTYYLANNKSESKVMINKTLYSSFDKLFDTITPEVKEGTKITQDVHDNLNGIISKIFGIIFTKEDKKTDIFNRIYKK